MENDFPFTFGDVSDEEAGSDGLFCAPKTKATSSKLKATLDQDPYYAQIDEDGVRAINLENRSGNRDKSSTVGSPKIFLSGLEKWFHHTGKSVEELMLQDKNGATKVKMQADHYYMLHQYQEAYDIAQEYCRVVANNEPNITAGDGGLRRQDNRGETAGSGVLRVTDSKEMHEMALRCALRLNKFGEAATLADELTIQDTGAVFLKAKAYMAVGRCNDAALKLVQYQKSRSSNYLIWKILGECLYQPAKPHYSNSSMEPLSISASEQQITTILALICILRARHLMRASTWSHVDYAQARYDREMKAMNDLRSKMERESGLNLKYVTDQIGRCGNGAQEDTELLAEYMEKIITPAQEMLRTLKEAGKTGINYPNSSFALEVVEFIVNSWDPQVLASAAPGIIQEDDDNELGEVSVRKK
ncbi:hypothetical protein BGZ80_006439 [Entomortierella chlamydospora]|uniref:Uncharacterized protein n=1 Tax=Entomortierella chlamydospora TaxID=101097 RepID=A0A9P6N077_9FUNG|nr:hypothetical protein BGZ80_006439 [Entomortierella chlamydospora]